MSPGFYTVAGVLSRLATVAALCLVPSSVRAQDPPSRWSVTTDANVFFGYNYQQRQFADFTAWESQNWFMGSADRYVGNGRLILSAMLSLEPFTIKSTGSPQLFQTGESYLFTAGGVTQRVPFANNQHPHDLFMGLGGTYRYATPQLTYVVGADVVGAATLGPPAFMHRESSRDNPQVPLTHHQMDSTHISFGVVRGGIETHGWTLEASAFRGEEPDEHRTNIEKPALDSWAARIGWHRGPWSAQFSGGHLKTPEWFEPYDETRLTASVGFDGSVAGRPLTATLGWGENRQEIVINGVSDGFLLEWDLKAARNLSLYGRAEIAEKEILGLGFHPSGFAHPHVYSHIDALTFGAVRDLIVVPKTRVGLGADVTLYHMSPDMLLYYKGSHSYHVFLRWRPTEQSAAHVH
jgi:hypothetical protein